MLVTLSPKKNMRKVFRVEQIDDLSPIFKGSLTKDELQFALTGKATKKMLSRRLGTRSEDECNRQYDYSSRTNNHSIRIGTILHVAAEHGIKLTPASSKMAAEPPAPPVQSAPAKTVVEPVPEQPEIVSDKIKFSPQQEQLFDALKKFRLTLSREKGVKAFQIFSNNTLHELVWNQPMTGKSLLMCKGIGPHKLEEFGDHIIALVQEHS